VLVQKNVFVDERDRAVIADFGLILVGQNTLGGLYTQKDDMSAPWVAPERLNLGTLSERPEASGDVYSFGYLCVMVRLLARRYCLSLLRRCSCVLAILQPRVCGILKS
jgi:hypothetical protein